MSLFDVVVPVLPAVTQALPKNRSRAPALGPVLSQLAAVVQLLFPPVPFQPVAICAPAGAALKPIAAQAEVAARIIARFARTGRQKRCIDMVSPPPEDGEPGFSWLKRLTRRGA